MEGECSECKGRLILDKDGALSCKECGLRDELSLIEAPSLTNLYGKYHVGGDNSNVPFGKLAKEYKKTKTEKEKRRGRSLNSVLRQIEILIDKSGIEKTKVIEQLREMHRYPILNKGIQGISHKNFSLAILISLLVGYYHEGLKRGNGDLAKRINEALFLIERDYQEDCKKASRMLSESIKWHCNEMNKTQDFVYFRKVSNPKEIDSHYKGIEDLRMFDLLYRHPSSLNEEKKRKLLGSFINFIFSFAQLALESSIDEQFSRFKEEDKSHLLFKFPTKMEGFVAACAYMVATSGYFRKMDPLPQRFWLDHFNLKKRTFARRLSELKKINVLSSFSLEGFFIQSKEGKPVFFEVPK